MYVICVYCIIQVFVLLCVQYAYYMLPLFEISQGMPCITNVLITNMTLCFALVLIALYLQFIASYYFLYSCCKR